MRFTRQGLLTAVLVVAALFVGSTLTRFLPNPDDYRDDPFPAPGVIGQKVALRTGDVTVTGIHGAGEVELYRSVAATPGVWLVADITFEPRDQPGLLTGSQGRLRAADGRVFGGAQALTNNCGPTNPGLPVRCQLPYEVPADALPGLVLVIPSEPGSGAADQVAEIDLGITEERATELAASQGRIALKESEVVAP